MSSALSSASSSASIKVREARADDVEQVRDIFLASYGEDYAYPKFYDTEVLTKLAYADDTLLLVAEDEESGRVVGTASVLLQTGAYADLVGEFGRLVVHPDWRRRRIGHALMEGRLERVRDLLHLGIVDARVAHPHSQTISIGHGFVSVGFMPMKLKLRQRESIALLVRYFGDGLALRRNHPRLIGEIYPLAGLALDHCGLPPDAIVDDSSSPYPHEEDFDVEELTTEGYAALLRFERGRVRDREICGPLQLHYGLFSLHARHASYLIARRAGQVAGAVGFLVDEVERAVRIFELVSLTDRPVRFLLEQLLERCRETWQTEYVEADVSGHAPRMQRTLLELGFLPSAYVPAMVFQQVERLDVVKMARLLVPPDFTGVELVPETRSVGELVMQGFIRRDVVPRVAAAAGAIALFRGLSDEQIERVAAACSVRNFGAGEQVFAAGAQADQVYLVIDGEVDIVMGGSSGRVGRVAAGESLGETSLLEERPHFATATARTPLEVALLPHARLRELVRRRPDIGVILYRNLARGLGRKLQRADAGRPADPSQSASLSD